MIVPWLAGVGSLLYVCSRFVPAAPPVHYGEIEDSYIQFWHTAFVQRLQFGHDIVYTYGPWALLYGGYNPATHLVCVIAWLMLSVVFWWTASVAARHFSKNKLASWAWLVCFSMVAGLPVFTLVDTRFVAFVVLLWLLYFFVEDRESRITQSVLVVALALVSLIKFNVFVEAVMVIAVISADTLFRRRRVPWLLVLFGAGILLFWVAAGQRVQTLLPYLRWSWQLTSGYTEGSMITGPAPELGVSCFVLASASICVLAGYAGWVRHKRGGIFSLLGLGIVLFLGFKHGYVRNDFHEAAAALELLLVSLAVLAVVWPIARNWTRGWALACFAPSLVVFVFALVVFGRYHERGLVPHFAGTFSASDVFAPVRLLAGPKYLREGYETYLAVGRDGLPLPAILGTVDTYPGDGDAILDHALPYRPRPIVQSMNAFTPSLAEHDAAFLRSERAPDSIVFQVLPVDDHYPTLDDGRSWPELLTHYDVQDVEWPWVLLRRSNKPRPWRLTPLADVPLHFGEAVDVPAATNGPVWATFEINKTVLGKFVSMLYKPPPLVLSVRTAAGESLRYRLIPGMAQAGFLLSPLVQDTESFTGIAARDGIRDLAGKIIASLSVAAVTESGSTACYDSTMRLRFFCLEFPGQDLNELEEFRALKSLNRAIAQMKVLRSAIPLQRAYSRQNGSVLKVPADSAFQVTLQGKPKALNISFGILNSGGTNMRTTNGITFRVSVVNQEGSLAPLWSQYVEAQSGNFPTKSQSATIELGGISSSELIFETVPDQKTDDRLQCYWSKIDFD